MSNYPGQIDTDIELPPVNDNVTEVGSEAINACRDAIFAIENEIGIGASGSAGTIALRLGLSLNPDGSIKPSAIASMGLVTLPIYNSHIASNAQILESKLKMDFKTQDLFNYIKDLSTDVNSALGWINVTGVKLDPHLSGALYKHNLSDISVNSSSQFKNKFELLRNNASLLTLFGDINDDLIQHQRADGYGTSIQSVTTYGGDIYPANFAHYAGGIYLNTSRFSTIPQTATSIQALAQFIDDASIFLYGTRIQNFYANGVSRTSRSSTLGLDGYGQSLVSPTLVTTYLLNNGTSTSPVDNIDTGDDIIEFTPDAGVLSNNLFDAQFALVKVGDKITVNYGGIEASFIINEKKYIQSGLSKKFIVRINGKNLAYSTSAHARIDKPLYNKDKGGVLAVAPSGNYFETIPVSLVPPSLIVGQPRSAVAFGLGFDAQLFNATHHLLYLALFPTGNIADGYTILPGIDVTGDLGTKPGSYTLDSIVESTNNSLRKKGYNYRFIAFQFGGEFGIMLADSYNGAGFSIISGVVGNSGAYDQGLTTLNFSNNVVGLFGVDGKAAPDPLGLGANGANVASPPYVGNYLSAEAAAIPTKLFVPLKRNNYYVNGIEREKLNIDIGQTLDGYGDGYWFGTVLSRTIIPGIRVKTIYRINQELSASKLNAGKTLVIQSNGAGSIVDYGRFIIEDVTFTVCPGVTCTDITVYDAVHSTGITPYVSLDVGNPVRIYFGADSVGFNQESATDFVGTSVIFKRSFEIFADQNGDTFSHERARFVNNGGTITINGITLYGPGPSPFTTSFDFVNISPKLRGYKFTSGTASINKISLAISGYQNTTGVFDGYLAMYDGISLTKIGKQVSGRVGEVTRFYDETNVDYIDLALGFNSSTEFTSYGAQIMDIQLFPSLRLDEELFPIATCQLQPILFTHSSNIAYVKDIRDFGNVSEKQLTTSALNYLSAADRLLHENGVVRGFDISEDAANPIKDQVKIKGGVALVNGKLVEINNTTISIPVVKEKDVVFGDLYNINWAICANDRSEIQAIPLLDYDASLSTFNAGSRIFWAINTATGLSYPLDAAMFSDLINKRKDLCILHIASSTVTGTGLSVDISLLLTDARKYVNDEGSNLPLKLTVGDAQGNFKNPIAILNWVKYNNAFNGRAIIKGASTSISSTIRMDFTNPVVIDGENSGALIFDGSCVIGSNITFKDISLTFNGSLAVVSSAQNIIFDNCNIVVNNSGSSTVFALSNTNNFILKNSSLTAVFATAPGGKIFDLSNSTGFKILNTNLSASYNVSPGTQGTVLSITDSANVDISGSTFTGNFMKFVNITNSTLDSFDLKLYNNTITTTHAATSDIGWISADLVNSYTGIIYSDVSSSLSNIFIDGCIFNFSPAAATTDRLSFITFVLSGGASVLKNLKISNCQFNTNVSSLNDKRSAIAIINTSINGTSSSVQPVLLNATISNNICNKDQAIILTSKMVNVLGVDYMTYPGLTAVNCDVSSNVCGTIGYFVSSATKTNNQPSFTNSNSRGSGLNIISNDCRYISNLNSTGKYFALSKLSTNYSQYPSGYVSIKNNIVNWIHTGCSYEENSSLDISDNSLMAYDIAYLDDFGDNAAYITTSLAYTIPTYKYAIVVSGNYNNNLGLVPDVGNDSNVTVSGNTTNTGLYVNSISVPINYEYGGYVCSLASAQITKNTFRGIANNITALTGSHGIVAGGSVTYITNNRIYRGANNIRAYIFQGHPYSSPTATSYGNITDNYFDSYSCNGTSDEDVSKSIPDRWTYERNKNQTGWLSVPMAVSGEYINLNNTIDLLTILPMPDQPGPAYQTYSSNVGYIKDTATPIEFKAYGWQKNISALLPLNVRLVYVKSGIRVFDSVFQTPSDSPPVDSLMRLHVSKMLSSYNSTNTNLDYFTPAFTENKATVFSLSTDTSITGGGNATLTGLQMNAISLTQYNSVQIEGTGLEEAFITGKAYEFVVSYELRLQRAVSKTINMAVSPIVVKYRW